VVIARRAISHAKLCGVDLVDAFGWEVIGSLTGAATLLVTIVFGVLPYIRKRKPVTTPPAPQPAIPPPGQRRSYLSRGQGLLVGESLYSPDGRTKFTLLGTGNMVVDVDGVGDIADTGTTNLGVPKCLKLEDNGWLVLSDIDGKELWKKGPRGVRLSVQDNSHVVLSPPVGYGDAIWATDVFFKFGGLVRWIPPEDRVRF
jgi:hypothetical protein